MRCSLGHIYIDSEYGKGALLGSQAYAKDHQQTVVPVAVTASDNDMTPAITQLKSHGASAVIITSTYTQMSSAATAMAAQGISDLPLLGNNPTFDPTLLATPAAGSMGNYYRVASFAPYAADKPVTQRIAKAYEANYTDPANDYVNIGYSFGLAYQAVLEKACDNKDLTRAGIVDAAQSVKVDTEGLTGTLDFSKTGQPSTRSTYIEQVDPNAKGGMKIVQDLTVSDEAKKYKTPFQG